MKRILTRKKCIPSFQRLNRRRQDCSQPTYDVKTTLFGRCYDVKRVETMFEKRLSNIIADLIGRWKK